MFDRSVSEAKFCQLMQEKTGTHFGENHEDSIVYEVEAERDYVNRLKIQREKVQIGLSRSKDSTPDMTSCSKT